MPELSKALVCDRSIVGIAGSIPTGGHGCLFSVLCVVCLLSDGLITRPEKSY